MFLARRQSAHPGKGAGADKQRDFDNDYNDNKNKEDGSSKKKKKAARKEQEKKVAKEAEGATKTYDEAVVLLADVILKGKRIAESWSPRKDQDDGIKELQKRLIFERNETSNALLLIAAPA